MLGCEQIQRAAYTTLLGQRCHELPISPHRFSLPFSVISFQDYARLAKVPINCFLDDPALCEGCSITAAEGATVLLYNACILHTRRRFVIAHELGHLLLGHSAQDPWKEKDADLFASFLLVPDALLFAFQQRGIALSTEFVTRHFQVSGAMAKRKLYTFERTKMVHTLDTKIQTWFYPALKRIAPMFAHATSFSDKHLDCPQ